MIHTYAITTDHSLIKDLSIEELKNGTYLWYWIDFDQATQEEFRYLSNPLQFHPLSIEDCLPNLQRPKIDYFEEYTFFVTHSLQEKTNKKEEITIFIADHFIVTFHHKPSNEIQQVLNKFLQETNRGSFTPYTILYELLDRLVDNYFPSVYGIEDFLTEIDENPTKKTMEVLLDELFETRHQLLKLRNTVIPMRDLVYKLMNTNKLVPVLNKKEYYSDIYDHLLKLTELIEANRELTTDIRDSYLSYNSHHSNRIMQILTVITTIFMPLSFMAGLYGMNFYNMPELSWKYGYFILLFIMVSVGIGMFLLFKKKGWFK